MLDEPECWLMVDSMISLSEGNCSNKKIMGELFCSSFVDGKTESCIDGVRE